MALHNDLRHALANGELRLDHQPIVSTSDGRITGVEALLRWVHPSHGIVGPDVVIPLAEQYGLIAEIGQWALERACLDSHLWPTPDGHDLDIAVNVSALQLLAPDFAASVERVLAPRAPIPRSSPWRSPRACPCTAAIPF